MLTEIEELADVGITLPPNMQGLTDDQIEDLHLKRRSGQTSAYLVEDTLFKKDKMGRRNGMGE